MNFEEFKNNVESWAEARGIYAHSTPEAQLLKAMSELGELADAQIKDDETEKSDAVIDTIVCLINYAHMSGIDLHKAMDDVWRIISQRTGRMVTGGDFCRRSVQSNPTP